MNRRPQLHLRSLFTATAVVAVLLGLWRLLGSRLGLTLIGVELLLPFVWRPRWLYSWFLPLVWTTVACNNFYYPGDEYGGFFFGGGLPGLWIIALADSTGSVPKTAAIVAAAGALTVAFAGWLLDKLRAPILPWSLLSLVTAAGLFAWTFGSYPTVERALAKNGSYEAYILPAINVGLTLATVVTLVGTGLYRLLTWFQTRGVR